MTASAAEAACTTTHTAWMTIPKAATTHTHAGVHVDTKRWYSDLEMSAVLSMWLDVSIIT
jgi:hypothetical protein